LNLYDLLIDDHISQCSFQQKYRFSILQLIFFLGGGLNLIIIYIMKYVLGYEKTKDTFG
jgi:hypothetical protein